MKNTGKKYDTQRNRAAQPVAQALIGLVVATALTACGGGGGGGSTVGDNDDDGGAVTILPPWHTPTQISTLSESDAYDATLIVDPAGMATALWAQNDGTHYTFHASRRGATGAWGAATRIDSAVSTGSCDGQPSIAADNTGNVMAVWAQRDAAGLCDVWFNRYVAGGVSPGWGSATRIEGLNYTAETPRIAVDPSGNALVVWAFNTASNVRSIWANRYRAGTATWSGAAVIENAVESSYNPALAMDSGGNAIALWTEYAGTSYATRSARFTAAPNGGGSWGGAVGLADDAGAGNIFDYDLAFDSAGNAMAVFVRQDGSASTYRVWARRYLAGGGWTGSEVALEAASNDNVFSNPKPKVAFDTAGNALAVWGQFATLDEPVQIFASRYTSGAGWGSAQAIGDGAGHAYRPVIAFDSSGNALTLWDQTRAGTTTNDILANRYDATNGWGTAQQIEAEASDALSVRIAISPLDDTAVAVWQQDDSDGISGIWANFYD